MLFYPVISIHISNVKITSKIIKSNENERDQLTPEEAREGGGEKNKEMVISNISQYFCLITVRDDHAVEYFCDNQN